MLWQTPTSRAQVVSRGLSGPCGSGMAWKQENQEGVKQECSFQKNEVANFNKKVKMYFQSFVLKVYIREKCNNTCRMGPGNLLKLFINLVEMCE